MFSGAASFERNLCGDAWVHSKATKTDMFKDSRGKIMLVPCTSVTYADASRQPIPERELIVHLPTTTSVGARCPKCSTFGKSGRVSCCAPGGAWYRNCGRAGNSDVDHKWFEGVRACKPTATTINPVCLKCVTINKSGKMSCCGPGGSWYRNCGSAGNAKFDHTWREG